MILVYWNLTWKTSKTENSLEFVSDENLNLNKHLLEGGGWIYRQYVRIKESRAKCVRLHIRGGGGVSNFGNFYAYLQCECLVLMKQEFH